VSIAVFFGANFAKEASLVAFFCAFHPVFDENEYVFNCFLLKRSFDKLFLLIDMPTLSSACPTLWLFAHLIEVYAHFGKLMPICGGECPY
jgi:hypothetical protein